MGGRGAGRSLRAGSTAELKAPLGGFGTAFGFGGARRVGGKSVQRLGQGKAAISNRPLKLANWVKTPTSWGLRAAPSKGGLHPTAFLAQALAAPVASPQDSRVATPRPWARGAAPTPGRRGQAQFWRASGWAREFALSSGSWLT